MPKYKQVNNELIEITGDELAELEAKEQAWTDGALNRELEVLRNKRNKLLTETDYLGTSDNTMSSDMTTYRQELRDLTNGLDTVEKVEAVEFPTKPSGE
jgi:chromosome segregation ATPase